MEQDGMYDEVGRLQKNFEGMKLRDREAFFRITVLTGDHHSCHIGFCNFSRDKDNDILYCTTCKNIYKDPHILAVWVYCLRYE